MLWQSQWIITVLWAGKGKLSKNNFGQEHSGPILIQSCVFMCFFGLGPMSLDVFRCFPILLQVEIGSAFLVANVSKCKTYILYTLQPCWRRNVSFWGLFKSLRSWCTRMQTHSQIHQYPYRKHIASTVVVFMSVPTTCCPHSTCVGRADHTPGTCQSLSSSLRMSPTNMWPGAWVIT